MHARTDVNQYVYSSLHTNYIEYILRRVSRIVQKGALDQRNSKCVRIFQKIPSPLGLYIVFIWPNRWLVLHSQPITDHFVQLFLSWKKFRILKLSHTFIQASDSFQPVNVQILYNCWKDRDIFMERCQMNRQELLNQPMRVQIAGLPCIISLSQ